MEYAVSVDRTASNRNFVKFLRHILNFVAATLFLSGAIIQSDGPHFSIMLAGVVTFWIADLVYCFENLKSRIVMLIFNLTVFLFLIGRAVINVFRDDKWWKLYTETGLTFALVSLFVTLMCMQIGAILFEFAETRITQFRRRPKRPDSPLLTDYNKWLALISLILFVMCWVCYMYIEVDKWRFMQGKEYEDYYQLYVNDPPPLFSTFATMMPYALGIYLATFPTKRKAIIPLFMYFVTAVPVFLIGQRNHIVLNALYIFLYFYLRGKFTGEEPWIGKFEKTALIILVPFVVILLAMYNYIRAGSDVDMGVSSLLLDFFDKQGVSFKVLTLGYDAIPNIHNTPFTNYTFGPLIDYWYYGSFGQKFLGAPSLGTGNNEFRATHGNDFSHSMSFVAKDDYLSGHGWGSSYLLETFADFGWLGVIIFSLILGMIFIFAVRMLRKGTIVSVIALTAFCNVFFVARASALGWLQFLWQPHFWITVAICFIGAKMFSVTERKRAPMAGIC